MAARTRSRSTERTGTVSERTWDTVPTETPACRATSLIVAMVDSALRSALFHLADFAHAAAELLRGAELRFEVCRQDLLGDPYADDPGAHANHVDIVVLHALVRRVYVMAERRTDAIHLVRGDAGPNSGSAHHDSPHCPACCHLGAHGGRDIRKIARPRRVRAAILHTMSPRLEGRDKRPLHGKARVIRTDEQLHRRFPGFGNLLRRGTRYEQTGRTHQRASLDFVRHNVLRAGVPARNTPRIVEPTLAKS